MSNIDYTFINSVTRLLEVYNRIINSKYDGSQEFVEKFLVQLENAVLVLEQSGHPSMHSALGKQFQPLDAINEDDDAVTTLMNKWRN